MTEYVQAWHCIGCGRIESPQTCLGICQDKKVEFVFAAEHEQVLARVQRLEALLRRIAWSTPRAGEWERSYRMLQAEARRVLSGK